MVGWEPDVAHRTLYIQKYARKECSPWHRQLSAKTEPEECKYPTALIDKERSSDNTVWCCAHKFMRPMTAGTSLSEAAVGRPSLLQAAVFHPSLSEAAVVFTSLSEAGTSTEHRHATQHQRPAPVPSTQHPALSPAAPPPRTLPAPAPAPAVSTTRTASAQHRYPLTAPSTSNTPHKHPAPAPSLHAHSQLRAAQPAPAPRHRSTTRTASSQHPAPAPQPAPAPGTATLSPRAQQRHTPCLESARSQLIVMWSKNPIAVAIWGTKNRPLTYASYTTCKDPKVTRKNRRISRKHWIYHDVLIADSLSFPGSSGARAPAPVSATPSAHSQRPVPTTRTASSHRRPVSTTRTASTQHRHRYPSQLTTPAPAPAPAPAPYLHHAHSQHPARHLCTAMLTAPAPAPGTQHRHPPRAQPAHSTSTSTTLSPPRAQPAASTGTGTLHRHPVSASSHTRQLIVIWSKSPIASLSGNKPRNHVMSSLQNLNQESKTMTPA